MVGAVNMDISASCHPDLQWDIAAVPWPLKSASFDKVNAFHIMEHLPDFWPAFEECARVLRVGGKLEIRTPHASSDSALTYRDHYRVFSGNSFHGSIGSGPSTNAWAYEQYNTVPLKLIDQRLVEFKEYAWMARWCPRLLHWCAKHLRNFVWEHQFIFERV